MRWSNPIARTLQWSGEIANREMKEEVAMRLAAELHDRDVIGVGSGSTSYLAIQAVAREADRRRLSITAIPTSAEVALTCAALGIPTTSLLEQRPNWCFDGADEVDPQHNLIKGRGGAMFREKLMICASSRTFVLVDETKLVPSLGVRFPVPVEVYPESIHHVEASLRGIGATEVQLRLARAKDGPVVTEAGNFILDVRFTAIEDDLEKRIKSISGVIESGLFIGYDLEVLVALPGV